MNKFKFWKHFKVARSKRKDGDTKSQKNAVHINPFRFFLQIRRDSLVEMLREAKSLNGLPSEIWCQRMYGILEKSLEECNQQLAVYDQIREEKGGSAAE